LGTGIGNLPRTGDHSAGVSIFLLPVIQEGKKRHQSKGIIQFLLSSLPRSLLKKEEKYLLLEAPYELTGHAFYIRFVERFCEYFGFVSIEKKEKRLLNLNYLVRTTPFFDELFQWKI
jgi:hypothetical protein